MGWGGSGGVSVVGGRCGGCNYSVGVVWVLGVVGVVWVIGVVGVVVGVVGVGGGSDTEKCTLMQACFYVAPENLFELLTQYLWLNITI